jgi:hypothetical protein
VAEGERETGEKVSGGQGGRGKTRLVKIICEEDDTLHSDVPPGCKRELIKERGEASIKDICLLFHHTLIEVDITSHNETHCIDEYDSKTKETKEEVHFPEEGVRGKSV